MTRAVVARGWAGRCVSTPRAATGEAGEAGEVMDSSNGAEGGDEGARQAAQADETDRLEQQMRTALAQPPASAGRLGPRTAGRSGAVRRTVGLWHQLQHLSTRRTCQRTGASRMTTTTGARDGGKTTAVLERSENRAEGYSVHGEVRSHAGPRAAVPLTPGIPSSCSSSSTCTSPGGCWLSSWSCELGERSSS